MINALDTELYRNNYYKTRRLQNRIVTTAIAGAAQ